MFTVTLTECGTGKKESWFVTQKAIEHATKQGYTHPYRAIVSAVRKGWGAHATFKRDSSMNEHADTGIYIRVHITNTGVTLKPLYRVYVKPAWSGKRPKTPDSYLKMENLHETTFEFLWRVCTALKIAHTNSSVSGAIGVSIPTYLAGIKSRKLPASWVDKLTATHLLNPEYLRTGEGLRYLVPSEHPYIKGGAQCEK